MMNENCKITRKYYTYASFAITNTMLQFNKMIAGC